MLSNDPFEFLALQEINHAGAGGLWAELVSNRGLFENLIITRSREK